MTKSFGALPERIYVHELQPGIPPGKRPVTIEMYLQASVGADGEVVRLLMNVESAKAFAHQIKETLKHFRL